MTDTQISISKSTISILKNFSTINSNLLVKQGNKISTIAPGKNMMAEATVTETFEVQFGIWDLSKFLGVVSLFESPTFEFHEKYVTITGKNGSEGKYHYSDPKLLTHPTKTVKMPEELATFEIYQDQFTELMKASSILQIPHLSFISDNRSIIARLQDKEDPTSNTYNLNIMDIDASDFDISIDVEHLKLLPGDYRVTVTRGPVCQFKNMSMDLVYWIALKSE